MHIPDRTLTGNGGGTFYEVFNPKWYRLDRWLWWGFQCVFNRKRPRITITVFSADETHSVRAIEASQTFPHVAPWPKTTETETETTNRQ